MAQRYFNQLNGLRAIAVLAVIATHTLDATHRHWVVWGEEGVTLFFVISGFLITGILLDAREAASSLNTPNRTVLRAFYARRFLRIFPIFYATIIVAAIADVPGVREAFWWQISYLSNWYIAVDNQWSVATHTWSLAVEEQFYLLWPLAVLFVPRRVVPWMIAVMVAVGPLTRGLLITLTDGWRPAAYIVTPATFDALGLGAALAWVWRSERSLSQFVRWCVAAGAALFVVNRVAVLYADADALGSVSRIWVPLLFVGVVYAASQGVPGVLGRALESAPLVRIGIVSYGMYLLHPFIEYAVYEGGSRFGLPVPEYGVLLFVGITVLSIGAATVSWRHFEAPINRRKSRHPYVPQAGSSDGQTAASSS